MDITSTDYKVYFTALLDDEFPIDSVDVEMIFKNSPPLNFTLNANDSADISNRINSSCEDFNITAKIHLSTLVDIPLLKYGYYANRRGIYGKGFTYSKWEA